MSKVKLLDCTLRDGGYINDWNFGAKGISAIIKKLEKTGIEMIEVGFLKGEVYNPDKTLFPDIHSIEKVLVNKKKDVLYVAMMDMNAPVALERITPFDGKSVDGIRVIFKKNKISEAYEMCKQVKRLGYKTFVNFVSTDAYTDKEFIEGIELFNSINPDGVTIVDTFGLLKRKNFRRLVAIADNNLNEDTMLCYHAHNNLQQAFGNAEVMVEMNLKRDIAVDACVFGMGRGAGNLNLELFAEYMNDNYDANYQISPMLEIMDEYLSEFYKTKFWGYSLPLYLSASYGCHPNYAIYFAEKNTLSEKAMSELLRGIGDEDRYVFHKDKAEQYYKEYMETNINDSKTLESLAKRFRGREVLLLAPGSSLKEYKNKIEACIKSETVVMSVNFFDENFPIHYTFFGNNRRYNQSVDDCGSQVIATSNVKTLAKTKYVVNFSGLTGTSRETFDNSGLMALRLLLKLGVKSVQIAGMDGGDKRQYYKNGFEAYNSKGDFEKDNLVAAELGQIGRELPIEFITPTKYTM